MPRQRTSHWHVVFTWPNGHVSHTPGMTHARAKVSAQFEQSAATHKQATTDYDVPTVGISRCKPICGYDDLIYQELPGGGS